VWRENPREPAAEKSAESLRDAVEAPAAAERSGADGAMERDAGAAGDREPEAERDARSVPAPGVPAAPPPSADAAAAAPSAAEEQRREEVLADQALEPARQAFLERGGRFEAAARAALAGRDTLAARHALALWSDSLTPAERRIAPRAALADSLERLLDAGGGASRE
jgi:hypothetical protein